jgi:release factor glutamine methyltransferase
LTIEDLPREIETLNIGSILDNLQITIFHHNDTPRLDAQVLLGNILGKPQSWILAHPEAQLSPGEYKRLSKNLAKIKAGMPLPYVIGHWEFYKLDFQINPAVLIPRPETELLVEKTIQWFHSHPGCRQAADIGTGSGCIAVSLALNLPGLQVTATDISKQALSVARLNANRHDVAERISFLQADLLPPSGPIFNLICANLPYIPSEILHTLEVFYREPTIALDGGLNGLALIQRLIRTAPSCLAPGGFLILEIEANQGKTAIELAEECFPGSEIRLVPDYAGYDRLLCIQT